MKFIFLFPIGLALAVSACSSTPAASSTSPQEMVIEASEFKFQPAMIQVSAGRSVKITLHNKGAVEHDWAIQKIPMMGMTESSTGGHDMGHAADKPDLHMNAMVGQKAQVEFTPTQAGTYQIYCTVAGHKEAGMIGTLVVK